MVLRNVLQLLFNPDALEKDSLEGRNDIKAETIQEIIKTKRKHLFSTLTWIIAPTIFGIITAQLVNYVCIIPSNYLPWIRTVSLSIFSFATLSRLEEMRTFDGDSLPEKTNTYLFRLIYSFGFFLTIATLFLDVN